jgi:hypothetical protein
VHEEALHNSIPNATHKINVMDPPSYEEVERHTHCREERPEVLVITPQQHLQGEKHSPSKDNQRAAHSLLHDQADDQVIQRAHGDQTKLAFKSIPQQHMHREKSSASQTEHEAAAQMPSQPQEPAIHTVISSQTERGAEIQRDPESQNP